MCQQIHGANKEQERDAEAQFESMHGIKAVQGAVSDAHGTVKQSRRRRESG
jgi:hypothetical protein